MPSPASLRRSIPILLLALAACDAAGPSAVPSASPSTPVVRGSLLPPSLVPTSLLPTGSPEPSCTWAADAAAIQRIDPRGRQPLEAIEGDEPTLLGERRAFRRDGSAWRAQPVGSRLRALAEHRGTLLALDERVIWRRAGNRWARDASPDADVLLMGLAGDPEPGGGAWAVGFRSTNAGDRVVTWRYANRRWSNVVPPSLGSGGIQRLNDATMQGAGLLAVGVAESKGTGRPLIVRHDGRRWTRATVPAPTGSSWTELDAVATVGTRIVAVGEAWLADGVRAVAYASDDDGVTWRELEVPQPGERGTRGPAAPPFGPGLFGIGGDDETLFAVGAYAVEHPRGGELLDLPFVLRLDGDAFVQEEVTGRADEQDPISLTDVGIDADGAAYVVGLYGNGAYVARRSCG